MRVPLTKVYRAFSELDEFSDEQCQGYVRRAKLKRYGSMIATATIAVPGCLIIAVVGWAVAFAIVNTVIEQYRLWLMRHYLDDVLEVVAGVFPPVVAMAAGLFARDVWLRYAIGKELVRSTCPACEYQLLGLPAKDGLVRCPECGNQSRVDLLGLSAEDLAMVKHAETPGPPTHPPLASPIRR